MGFIIKQYSISFELARLTKDQDEAAKAQDWVRTERELTFPFKPMETLTQTEEINKLILEQ